MSVSIGGYLVAAAGFLLLGGLLLISRQGLPGRLIAAASIITAVWAGLSIQAEIRGGEWYAASGVADACRHAAWFAFLLVVLIRRQNKDSGLAAFRVVCGLAAVLPALVATGWLVHLLQGAAYPLLDPEGSWGVAHLLMSILGVVLLENLARGTPAEARYGTKFFVIGLGGVFAYDLFLYADALLFRAVDEGLLAARGIVNAVVLPLIAVALMRNPDWEARIHVSRGVAFHSATLMASGAFLLIMAAAGYYVRIVGGAWGEVVQVSLVFAALVVAAATAVSGRFRSGIILFLNRNFYSYQYDYRREWMRFLAALSGEGQERLEDRMIRAVADVFDVPDGMLWLREEHGFAVSAAWNVPPLTEVEPDDSPLVRALNDKVACIDLSEDLEATGCSVSRPGWLRLFPRAWLLVPLVHRGDLLGFLVLGKPRVPRRITLEDRDLLHVLSRQAASYLAEWQAVQELTRARQFEEFNKRSTFVVHGIKSLSSQLALLVANAEKHRDNPEFQKDLIETLQDTVDRMAGLMSKLQSGSGSEPDLGTVPLGALVDGALKRFKTDPSRLMMSSELEDELMVSAPPEGLKAAVQNLVQNALDATGPAGRVQIRLRRSGDTAVVEVDDNGPGMSREFVASELFQPFRSTKSGGFGIGVYECKQVVERAGGRMEVETELGKGTRMRLLLPVVDGSSRDEPRGEPVRAGHAVG